MFVCIECNKIFDEPQYWEETHGWDHGPYEQWSGCPYCGGSYAEAYKCDCCDEFITDNYIKIENKRYCQDCCLSMELGEE